MTKPFCQAAGRGWAVCSLIAAAYLLVFPYFPRINNPNENVRIWMTRAIVNEGTFAVDGVVKEWGEVSDRAVWGSHTYSSKAPGTSLLGVPVLWTHTQMNRILGRAPPSQRAITWSLRVFTVALPLSIFFVLFASAVERHTGSAWARDLLTLGLALGTLLYPYGLMFVGHAQSAGLAFAAYLLMADTGPASSRKLTGAGLLAGLAVVFEYQSLFVAVLLAGYALWLARGRAFFFAAGALVPALLLCGYHAKLFGSPFTFPYAHIYDPGFRELHHTGAFFGLGRPRLPMLFASFFAIDYGLFIFSPFLLLGFVLALDGTVRRGTPAHVLTVAVTVVMGLFISGMSNWRGGWCAAGPRYIATVAPFLAWSLAVSWQEIFARRPWLQTLLLGLVMTSVMLCALPGALFPHYPVQFNNPIYDAVWPLLRAGYAPHSLGTVLGWHGYLSWLPLGLVVLATFALVIGSSALSPPQRLLALGVPLLLLGLLALPGRRPSPDEDDALTFIKTIWEPPVTSGDFR